MNMCNLVTSFVRLSQGCVGVVKISQGCDKVVTNMTLWSQGCSELVKLLHGCDEVVARLQGLYNLATTLSFLYGRL